jgi:hypothetical protein
MKTIARRTSKNHQLTHTKDNSVPQTKIVNESITKFPRKFPGEFYFLENQWSQKLSNKVLF